MSQRDDAMWTSLGLLVLRVGFGGMLLAGHGWEKLTHFSEIARHFPDPLGLGSSAFSLALVTFAEFFCALAVVLGAMTRIAAVPVVITMAVAAFVVHAADPWAKVEFALLYGVPFLALVCTGAGQFSVDGYWGSSTRSGKP